MQLRSVLDADFFDRYWRRAPVVFRGAIDSFLGERPTTADFEEWQRASQDDPARGVKTDGQTVFFLEQIDSESLHRSLIALREVVGWRDVSCGSVRTLGVSSVGPHFDNSDNFAIQVEGTKTWRLVESNRLPQDAWRRRMLVEPGFGALHRMPADALTFELEPGDVLYLPLMWPHWGTSGGDSLSITLAVNAPSALETLSRLLRSELADQEAWWQPFPVPFDSVDVEQLLTRLAEVDLVEAMSRLR